MLPGGIQMSLSGLARQDAPPLRAARQLAATTDPSGGAGSSCGPVSQDSLPRTSAGAVQPSWVGRDQPVTRTTAGSL